MKSVPVYVSVKAFGDFVIAATCLQGVGSREHRPKLLVGDHLADLARALDADVDLRRLPLRRVTVPALFDVKAAGPLAAVASAVDLVGSLGRARSGQNEVLVFDVLGFRQKLIAPFGARASLPRAANIYSAYRDSLRTFGFQDPQPVDREQPRWSGRVGIFPASRIAEKSIPLNLLAAILKRGEANGVETHIYLLEGEREDVRRSGLPFVALPRDFVSLVGAVRGCGAVISADSLAAHLAEHFRLPVLVLTPRDNEFWLPASAYASCRWKRFGDPDVDAAVAAFMSA